ncbi:MAG: hypothetical protein J5848_06160 [Bacteroidales bacterium]|nr:hypothetical protein [Bacteroidales bacterium]
MNRLLRHIAPFVLLATYLPMVVLSSMHVHHDTVDVHDDCLQCVGHFETAHHHDHDCLFCTFLSLNYFGESTEQSTAILSTTERFATPTVSMVQQFYHGVASMRAPPTA